MIKKRLGIEIYPLLHEIELEQDHYYSNQSLVNDIRTRFVHVDFCLNL